MGTDASVDVLVTEGVSRRRVPRLPLLDVLRGIALCCMVLFHFVWDATSFGVIGPELSSSLGWRLFGFCILGTFLGVSGFSLTWAFMHGSRLGNFLRRIVKVGLCAGLVSLSTWLADRDYFIYFGVLHHIALGSAILLLLQKGSPLLWGLGAVVAIVLPRLFRPGWLDTAWFWWLGLCQSHPASPDYVPLLPWFSIMLAGSLAARIWQEREIFAALGSEPTGALGRGLGWAGRKSLWIYMLHQPLLFGSFQLWVYLFPAAVG